MTTCLEKAHTSLSHKILCSFIAVTFGSSVILPPGIASAQSFAPTTILDLPVPGTMVPPSAGFMPALMTGITIHPDNPLRFDFIMDRGQSGLAGEPLEEEYKKMIKYFMASLTVPEDELWVNLSPYEKDRMVPQGLGDTEMGRDMLAQDYLLKQLTASLMYPEKELGKEFWNKVYKEAQEKFGTTEIPVNTFNKVWIVPDEALVYEQGSSAFVIKSRLAVMLEEDYEAMGPKVTKSQGHQKAVTGDVVTGDVVTTGIIREVIIPAIEKEVNEGKNFASLRQIYNALILATWYKQRLKDSLLGKVYVDQNKTRGIDTQDKEINQKIYGQYIESFKRGVYNFIKEDYDPATQQVIPRKYFSGGARLTSNPIKGDLKLRPLSGRWKGLVLGVVLAFGISSFSPQDVSAAMAGDRDGVTTEFVENSPNNVTVTVHNGKNVRPVLLAQAAPLSMKKQGQGSRVKGQGFSIDKDASSPVGDGAGKQESGLDLFLRKLRGLNADESQMGFSQGMDGSFVWSDGLERGMRIIFDQEKRTIRLKSQQHGEYFEFLQAPEFTRVKTFQWEVKVGGVYLVSIGYHKGNRPEDNHLYLILRDGAERKLLAAKKQEAAGLKAELEERYLGNPETTVDSHQSERAAVLGDKLEQAIPHGEDLGELLSLMQEVQKFLRGDNVDNEGFVLNPGIYLKIKRRMQNEGGMRWWPGDISIFSESEFKELAGKDTSLVTIFSNKPRSRAQEPDNIDNLDAVEIPLTMDVANVLDIFGDPYSTHAERHQALGLGDSVEVYQFGYEILLPWLIQQDETILKRFIRERLRHEIVVPVPAISPHQEYNTIATFVLSTYEAARESSEDSRERFEKAMVELLDEAVERAKDMPGSLPREEEDYIYWLLHILDRVHSPSVVPVLEKTVREGVLNVFSPKINAEILRNFLGLPHSLSRAELMAGFGRENESIGLLFRNVYELSKSHSLFLLPGFLRLRLGESARGIYFLEDFFKEEHDIKEAVAPLSEEEKAELSRELREVWEAVKIALDNRPRIQLHSSASEELRKMVEEVPKEEEAASRKIEDILRALDDGNFAREVRSDGGSASSPVTAQEVYSYYQKAFPGLIRQDPEGKHYIMHNLIFYFLPAHRPSMATFPSISYERLTDALSVAREEILDSLTIEEIENFDVLYAFLMAHRDLLSVQRTEVKEIIEVIDRMRRGEFVEERELGKIRSALPGLGDKITGLLNSSQDNERTTNKQKLSLEEVLKKFIPGEAVILKKIDILPGKQSSIPPGSIMVGFLGNDISEGGGVVLSNGGRTSNIKRIVETMDASALKVQTDTSTYEIKILTEITDRLISGERKLQKGDVLGKNNFNVVGIVTNLDFGSGMLKLKIYTKDEVSEESTHSRNMQDRITLGEYRAWEIAASSPASSSVSEERVPTAARLVGMEATSDKGPATKGGIDLNPALLDLQIKRDGNGVPLPLPMQPIENMHIDGFLPVIINIVPITNLPLLLGLDLPVQERDQAQLTYQQLSAGLTQNKERIYGRDPEEIFYPDYLKRANKNLDKNRA